MLNVIVTDPPRADLAQVGKLAGYGTATVHGEQEARRGRRHRWAFGAEKEFDLWRENTCHTRHFTTSRTWDTSSC